MKRTKTSISVKILKCSDKDYWYADKIGQTLKVNYMIGNDFRCWHPDGLSSYLVLREDCEIVRVGDVENLIE
jgi:hypothetical protein